MFSRNIPGVVWLTRASDWHRVSIVLDAYRGLIGVGDSPSRAEGEKLAALSALYQLVATGMVSLIERGSTDHLADNLLTTSDQPTQPRP
jgi:hypothetical protein